MQNPLILGTPTPPGGLVIPVTPAPSGGLAGLILTGQAGAPCTVEVSLDAATWEAVSYPHALAAGTHLRLTRTDASPTASVIGALTEFPTVSVLQDGDSFPVSLASGESRTYTLDLPSGANGLRVRTSGGQGDVDFTLKDPGGSTLAKGNSSGNEQEVFLFQAAAAGAYPLILKGFDDANTTTLSVSWDPYGPLPTETLTASAAPQGLTLPPGTTHLEVSQPGRLVDVSYDDGATWSELGDWPARLTAEEAAQFRFRATAWIGDPPGQLAVTYYVPS